MRFNELKSTLNKAVSRGNDSPPRSECYLRQTVGLTRRPDECTIARWPAGPDVGLHLRRHVDYGQDGVCLESERRCKLSPVVITTTPGSNLTINLTNNLPSKVPETSLVIVGPLGAGLGTTASSASSPAHATQSATWPIAGDALAHSTPAPAANRVVSFSTPVANRSDHGARLEQFEGRHYLIESGTHPSIQGPMGLYECWWSPHRPRRQPATAYTGVSYNAENPACVERN